MKTGIVLEINSQKASILMSGGRFKVVTAQKGWNVGDTVILRTKSVNYSWMITSAACIALIFSLSFFSYTRFFSQSTLISIDVNPSIEIQLNSMDRVTNVTAMNREGKDIIDQTPLKNKKLGDALTILFEQGLDSYLSKDAYVTFTVLSSDKKKEDLLLDELQVTADSLVTSRNQNAQIEAYAVDKQTVQAAHSHQLTAGKYNALQELIEVYPQADMNEYTHCSISEIKSEIEHHSECTYNTADVQESTSVQGNTDIQGGCHQHSGNRHSHN